MNKYHNKKVYYAGREFDSKAEAHRYRELCLLQKAGKIHNLECQVSFKLADKQEGEARGIYYTADFTYTLDILKIAEDVKGFATDSYVLKRKLFKERYPDYKFSEIRNGETTGFATFKMKG